MIRWVTALCCILPTLLTSSLQAQGAPSEAEKAMAVAIDALREGRYTDAIDSARAAVKEDPALAKAWAALGQAYSERASQTQYDKERAIEAYAKYYMLTQDALAKDALDALFFDGPPPRWLASATLAALPGSLHDEVVQIPDGDDEGRASRICATTGLVYPSKVPTYHPRENKPFSRVSYGYVADPTDLEGRLYHRATLYYPSPAQSATGIDYRATASNALALILRLFCYRAEYFGEPVVVEAQEPLNIWFIEGDETGAELRRGDMTVYGVNQPRTPLAWVREICHEFGHFSFPPIGLFNEPEPWANGLMGEYVLPLWLSRNEEDGMVRWGSEPVDLEALLDRSAGPLVQGFFAGVPDGNRLYDKGIDGVNHCLGLALYADLLLGPRVLSQLAGEMEESADLCDYMDALRVAFEARRAPLTLPVRLFSQPESMLEEGVDFSGYEDTPLEIPSGRTVVYWVYLARGSWILALSAEPPLESAGPLALRVSAEGQSPSVTVVDWVPGARIASAELGPKAPGWYRITLEHDNRETPLLLERLVFARQDAR